MKTCDYISITKTIFDSKLIIKVQEISHLKKLKDHILWNIKVMHNQKIIFESQYTDQTEFTISLNDTGRFVIFVQARNTETIFSHFRDSIWFYTDEERTRYQNWYCSFQNQPYYPLPFFNLKYPYQNLAALFSKRRIISSELTSAVKSINSNLCVTTIFNDMKGLYLISESLPYTRHSKILSFSGKTKYKGQFIYGQNDIPSDVIIDVLADEIGYHTMFWGDPQYFEITNDYFGTYPLYYYDNEEIGIVSNSYHLIVLLAKRLNLRLTLDIDGILPYFVTGERMLFEQLASHQSFISEIKKIPIHLKCIISAENGLVFKDKSIANIMRKNITFNKKIYSSLIKKSAQEIIENINIILKDKRIEHVVVDVSGGKDSRVVLAALLKCNHEQNNIDISVFSKDVSAKKDKAAFIPLNHLHDLPYDIEKETYTLDDINRKDIERRSLCLGTFFNRTFPWQLTSTAPGRIQRIRLTGAGGDMLLCPYFPMSFQNISYDSLADTARSLSMNYNNGIVNFEKLRTFIESVIVNGLCETLGKDSYDRFNNYYLYFRNVYHFGPEVMLSSFETGEEKWTPLYSKSAFLIRQMAARQYGGIRVAIDLINELAPFLLKAPFNASEYNKELEQLKKNDTQLANTLSKESSEINYDDSEWNEAQKIKAKNRSIIHQENIARKNHNTELLIYDKCLYRLNKVLHYDNRLKEVLGIDLYIFLSKNEPNMHKRTMSRDLAFLYNKITTVYDLINIISEA